MKKYLAWILAAVLAAACTVPVAPPVARSAPAPQTTADALADLGPAPEWDNEIWLNAETPLRLADLRGQVILVDMWTFG